VNGTRHTDAMRGPALRLPRRDRAWCGNEMVWGLAGIPLPPIDELRLALVDAARSDPAQRYFRTLDPGTGWSTVPDAGYDRFSQELVTGGDVIPDSLTDALATERLIPLRGLPFRLVLGNDCVMLHYNHSLGDVASIWPLFLAMINPAQLRAYTTHSTPNDPLLTAMWHTFARNPRRLIAVLRSRRTAIPIREIESERAPAEDLRITYRRSDEGFRRRLRDLRVAEAPGASTPGYLLMRAIRTANQQGLRPFPGAMVLADARRYLPSRTFTDGNFAAAGYVNFDDPLDATEVSRRIGEYADSARPLLTLAAMTVAAPVRTSGDKVRRAYEDTAERSLIAFSQAGRLPMSVSPEMAMVIGRPVGRRGLAVIVAEINRRLHVSVTHDRSYVADVAADAVADALVASG
jgi:hypothetical protein